MDPRLGDIIGGTCKVALSQKSCSDPAQRSNDIMKRKWRQTVLVFYHGERGGRPIKFKSVIIFFNAWKLKKKKLNHYRWNKMEALDSASSSLLPQEARYGITNVMMIWRHSQLCQATLFCYGTLNWLFVLFNIHVFVVRWSNLVLNAGHIWFDIEMRESLQLQIFVISN